MKLYTVRLSSRTERQLDELHAYIAINSGRERANHYIERVVASCYSLAHFPERCTLRADLGSGMRVTNCEGRTTIVFTVDSAAATVLIHGIFYGGQDIESALRDEPIN